MAHGASANERSAWRPAAVWLAALGALALVANSALFAVDVRRMAEADAWVGHTRDVLDALQSLHSALQDAESGQRGFLLTGAPEYLGPWNGAGALLDARLARLEGLARDSPERWARIAEMRPLIEARVAEMRHTIALRGQPGGFDAARAVALTNQGMRLMAAARDRIAAIGATERQLMERRAEASRVAALRMKLVHALTWSIGLASIGAGLALAAAQRRAAARAEGYLHRYGLVAKHSRDIVLFLRRDGRILEANDAALAAYGYGREELERLSIRDLRAAQTRPDVEEQMARADAAGLLFDSVHRRKDGSTFPVEVSSQGATIDGARTLISIIRDTTQRKEAEDALRRSEAQLQGTVEGLAEGLIVSTMDGEFVHWNQAALQLHGFGSIDEVRRHLADFQAVYTLSTLEGRALAPEEWPLSRLQRGEPVRGLELVLRRRADGWTRAFSYGGSIVQGKDGQRLAILTVSDVTERTRAVAELAAERDHLRRLAEALPHLVWAADGHGRPHYFNQRWRDYTGQAPGSEAWEPALHQDDRERMVGLWRDAVALRKELEVEHRLRRADGEYRWFLQRAFLLPGDRAASDRWFGTCTDIHDLKVSQEILRQADRLKDDFLAMASHELRTPLTALSLRAETLRRCLRRSPAADEDAQRQLSAIDDQTRRLEGLIGLLLDVSRINVGRFTLDLSTFDLAEVAREVAERLKPDADLAGAELRLSTRLVIGRWDRMRLDQVVTNLVGNAIKYGPCHPVDVTVGERDGAAVVEVRDRGIGIPPESHRRIFERFERAGNVSVFRGLGLGLWIAKRLVEAHGGIISVESAPGAGSTFTVSLPRTPRTQAAGEQSEAAG